MDAGLPDAGPTSCDPTPTDGGSTGCPSGQRCTWVALTMTTGISACVPMGSVPVGGTCMPGNPLVTGYDECVAGSVCIGTECKPTCALSDPNSCGTSAVCTSYQGLFANDPDAPATGACVPTCDPLAMLPCPTPGQGCYLLTSSTTTIAVCAGAGTVMHGQAITGTAYANSCVPGAMPRRVFGTNSFECGGLCRPAEVTMGVNVASEGGVSPNSCQTRWGAAAPSDAMSGESCRYFWAREPFSQLSPFSNTLGFCFKHATALYDSNGDMMNDAPVPRCTTLTTGDVVPPIDNPAGNDALSFWCIEKPAMKRAERVEKQPAPWLPRLTGWR